MPVIAIVTVTFIFGIFMGNRTSSVSPACEKSGEVIWVTDQAYICLQPQKTTANLGKSEVDRALDSGNMTAMGLQR